MTHRDLNSVERHVALLLTAAGWTNADEYVASCCDEELNDLVLSLTIATLDFDEAVDACTSSDRRSTMPAPAMSEVA